MTNQQMIFNILKKSPHAYDRAAAIESSQFNLTDLSWALTDINPWVRLAALIKHGKGADDETLQDLCLDSCEFVREEASRLLQTFRG